MTSPIPDSLTLRPFKQAADIADRLRDNDNTFFRLFDHPINYNEWHNLSMGVIGYPLGRRKQFSLVVVVSLVAISLPELPEGESSYRSGYSPNIGLQSIGREPWYFIASLLTSFLVGLAHAE